MKSKLLDLDMLIKDCDSKPTHLPKLSKIVLQINHNPAIKNRNALYTAIAASMDLTNQYPKINTATASYSSFNIRKGMQYSLITTLRNHFIKDFYLKFMFLVYPQYFILVDTSILSNVYPASPSNHHFHIGIKINNLVSANILFVLQPTVSPLSLFHRPISHSFFFSYWNLPCKHHFTPTPAAQ